LFLILSFFFKKKKQFNDIVIPTTTKLPVATQTIEIKEVSAEDFSDINGLLDDLDQKKQNETIIPTITQTTQITTTTQVKTETKQRPPSEIQQVSFCFCFCFCFFFKKGINYKYMDK